MVVCKKWVLCTAFAGPPEASNFKLETEELPDQLKSGGKVAVLQFVFIRMYYYYAQTLCFLSPAQVNNVDIMV